MRCQRFGIISHSLDELHSVNWSGENSIKWPLLTKLSHRYFSAPATSSESERLFSTAGLVVSNLRTRLLPDNVEKLLFLHNNLKIYDYKYDL
uniref:HAT C-terminal dimerisation domain-containing protein n=2 Tax=Meloidogyne TaxID=189290 RepID=A0A6V7TV95_MELEN|nr:unnamed protein product [Meloidogyne enterolobii]